MTLQYVKKKTKRGLKKIGLFLSEVVDGRLRFGYSMLNPADERAVRDENAAIIAQIKQIKRTARRGKEAVEGLPSLLPVFDREKAIGVARERFVDKVKLSEVPENIRRQYERFCRNAIARFHAAQYIDIR